MNPKISSSSLLPLLLLPPSLMKALKQVQVGPQGAEGRERRAVLVTGIKTLLSNRYRHTYWTRTHIKQLEASRGKEVIRVEDLQGGSADPDIQKTDA